jgi:Flp pilus assembly protein TadD
MALDPTNRSAILLHLTALTGAGHYGEARTELTRLVRENPQAQDLQFQLGVLAVAEKKYTEAARIFENLRERTPADNGSLAALVETYAAQGQLDGALDMLAKEAQKSPDSVGIHKLRASIAARAQKYDLAIAEYQSLLAADPKSLPLRRQLAEAYRLNGDLKQAIAVMESAGQLAPNDSDGIMFLSSLLQAAGRSKEAESGYRRILSLQPDNPFILNNIASLLADTGGDLDEALRLIQRGLQKAPEHPVLTDTLGWVYFRKGMNDSALRTFSNLVQRYPKNPEFHYHFAAILAGNGDTQRARTELNNARSLQPPPEIAEKIEVLGKQIG